MKQNNPMTRLIMAILPVWALSGEAVEIGAQSAVTVVLFWTSVSVAQALRSLIPEKYFIFPFTLWLACMVQIAFSYLPFPAFWTLSVILLLPATIWEGKLPKGWVKDMMVTGAAFWLFSLYRVTAMDLLGERLMLRVFQAPSGQLMLFALAAVLLNTLSRREADRV